MPAAVLALLAALANSLASVLQRRAAANAPRQDALHWRLLVDLIRTPIWALGILSLIAGFLLQAAALSMGKLALVEPLLIAELPLTLILAAVIFGGRITVRDWAAVAAISIGLAFLLLALNPSGGNAQASNLWRWTLTGAAGAAFVGILVSAAIKSGGERRAALLATAAGSGFGITAGLMKASTGRLAHGVLALFTSPAPYAMVICGLGSLYLFNNALQAGRLIAAQPAVTLMDPLVSVLLGVWLFDERLHLGLLLVPELVGVALIGCGAFTLAGSPHLRGVAGKPVASGGA